MLIKLIEKNEVLSSDELHKLAVAEGWPGPVIIGSYDNPSLRDGDELRDHIIKVYSYFYEGEWTELLIPQRLDVVVDFFGALVRR